MWPRGANPSCSPRSASRWPFAETGLEDVDYVASAPVMVDPFGTAWEIVAASMPTAAIMVRPHDASDAVAGTSPLGDPRALFESIGTASYSPPAPGATPPTTPPLKPLPIAIAT